MRSSSLGMSSPVAATNDSIAGSKSGASSNSRSVSREMTEEEEETRFSPRWLPELLSLRQRHWKGSTVGKENCPTATRAKLLQNSSMEFQPAMLVRSWTVHADSSSSNRMEASPTTNMSKRETEIHNRKQQKLLQQHWSSSSRCQQHQQQQFCVIRRRKTARSAGRPKQTKSRALLRGWLLNTIQRRSYYIQTMYSNKTVSPHLWMPTSIFRSAVFVKVMVLLVVLVVGTFRGGAPFPPKSLTHLTTVSTAGFWSASRATTARHVVLALFYDNPDPNQKNLVREKVQFIPESSTKKSLLRRSTTSSAEPEDDPLPIVFPNGVFTTIPTSPTATSTREQKMRIGISLPPPSYEIIRQQRGQQERMRQKRKEEEYSPDLGGLEMELGLPPGTARIIRTEKELFEEEEEDEYGTDDGDDSDGEDDGADDSSINSWKRRAAQYALDDDYQEAYRANVEMGTAAEEGQGTSSSTWNCRKVQEYRYSFPTCNELHQLDHSGDNVLPSGYGYINSGYFRDVFSFDHHYAGVGVDVSVGDSTIQYHQQERVAIKQILYKDNSAELDYYEYVRIDALVAERLTANPRIFDIYGYCGLSVLSEYFYHGDLKEIALSNQHHGWMDPADLEDEDDVDPQNDLTPEQKLVLALEMAQGLADLHGYAGGLIIHDDVTMSQFLLNKDKTRLKLNDFNRAELPLWDDRRQEYCRYRNGRGHGFWRSPEEYKNEPLTEAIDVWSLGNNLYGLLTGLNPLYDIDTGPVPTRIIHGETGYIDPRYFERSKAENALAIVIQKCYKYLPEERPTVFEVVQELDRAVSELLEPQGISRASVLQDL